MSCYKYWGKIEEIADKLSSYGDLDNEGLSALDGTDIDEITMILDEIEVIAHDKEIDFDSAKHILDDEKMNKALQLIRKFYVKASVLQHSVFFMVLLSFPNMTTGKTRALTIWTCAGKVVSLLFNMLSRFVIVFLPIHVCKETWQDIEGCCNKSGNT